MVWCGKGGIDLLHNPMRGSSPKRAGIAPRKSKRSMPATKRTTVIVIVVVVALAGAGLYGAVRAVLESGITRGPDQRFGDQHLKTAVALVELHKVRYGRYPAALRELKFTGNWDAIALNSVAYYPASGRHRLLPGGEAWLGWQAGTQPAAGVLAGNRLPGGTEAAKRQVTALSASIACMYR